MRVTLIEDDTALVSWREPTEPNVAVTHYTILYASQKAWLAGHWQIIQREGEWGASTETFIFLCISYILSRAVSSECDHRDTHHGSAGEAGARERLPGENLFVQPGRRQSVLRHRGAGAPTRELTPPQEPQAFRHHPGHKR